MESISTSKTVTSCDVIEFVIQAEYEVFSQVLKSLHLKLRALGELCEGRLKTLENSGENPRQIHIRIVLLS